MKGYRPDEAKTSQFEEYTRVGQRLLQGAPVQDIDAISVETTERDFEGLARSVRESIDKNEPEAGLDRLHTFVVKYMRLLCRKHGIETDKEKPLHSLIGEYVKLLRGKGLIESEMAERILKSSISILEAFNHVRNDQSLAHDNQVLKYHESLLIFGYISSTVKFLKALEEQLDKSEAQSPEPEEDIPF